MKDLDLDRVWAACPGGPPTWAVKMALTQLLDLRQQVGPGKQLAVWTFCLLSRELPYAQENIGELFVVVDHLHWDALTQLFTGTPPLYPTATNTAARYVGLAGIEKVIDVTTGEWLTTVPRGPIETKVYDLAALYDGCFKKANETGTNKSKGGE